MANINHEKKENNNTDSLNLNLSPDNSSRKSNISNSIEESSVNSNHITINNCPILSKRLKQLENIISQKFINLNDLKKFAWNGVPFGR